MTLSSNSWTLLELDYRNIVTWNKSLPTKVTSRALGIRSQSYLYYSILYLRTSDEAYCFYFLWTKNLNCSWFSKKCCEMFREITLSKPNWWRKLDTQSSKSVFFCRYILSVNDICLFWQFNGIWGVEKTPDISGTT